MQTQKPIKELLDCFDYLKKYQVDILDSVFVFLEFFLLKANSEEQLQNLIQKGTKRKKIYQDFCDEIQTLLGVNVVQPNPNINLLKILKVIDKYDIEDLEIFFDTITQKKVTNKLFYYSTPLELNKLLLLLLEIGNTDSLYNPCCGIGSLFITLWKNQIGIYGEELDQKLTNIASLICRILKLQKFDIRQNDILKNSSFKQKDAFMQFDKIICNPPLQSHMGTQYIKDDARFSRFGILSKTYPELIFLTHSLVHLKTRGVFIIRSQILQNPLLEQKLKQTLIREKMIEAIIELPKNIFPHQNYDFSILVIKPNSQNLLYINASNPKFFIKEGKYNKLNNIEEIYEIFRFKKEGQHSKIINSLYELNDNKSQSPSNIKLKSIVEIFRGQRAYGSNKDGNVEYFDVGVGDFSPYGLTQSFQNKKYLGDKSKIQKYMLKPYDILISLRGNKPKITLLGEEIPTSIANAGILILRAKKEKTAIALYCYFFSKQGEESLHKLYKQSGGMDFEELSSLEIPKDFEKNKTKFMAIQALAKELQELQHKISKLKEA